LETTVKILKYSVLTKLSCCFLFSYYTHSQLLILLRNLSNILIKVSEEGTYLAIENSNNIIYKSTNAQVWDKYFSISELTNNFSYSPQAFAMDKNIAFILSNNNTLIRIDTENDNTRVYDYSGNTWRTPNNVLDVLIQAVDGKVFLLDNYAPELEFETYKLEVLGFYKNNPVIKTGSRFFIYKY
jgi:hypothetical protein